MYISLYAGGFKSAVVAAEPTTPPPSGSVAIKTCECQGGLTTDETPAYYVFILRREIKSPLDCIYFTYFKHSEEKCH